MDTTLGDILYRLGDAIGWGRCDYATDRSGERYGVTDGTVTLGVTLDDSTVYWQTSCQRDGTVDPLEDGTCPAGDRQALVDAWRRAASLSDDRGAAAGTSGAATARP